MKSHLTSGQRRSALAISRSAGACCQPSNRLTESGWLSARRRRSWRLTGRCCAKVIVHNPPGSVRALASVEAPAPWAALPVAGLHATTTEVHQLLVVEQTG